MKMRVIVPLLMFLAIATSILYGCGRKATGELKSEYRMQINVGPTTYWGMGAAKFAELASKKTGGRIKIKPYYGSQLLKGAQLNSSQMVALGAIDCAFESTINTAPVIEEMNIFSLPFFINTYDNLDKLEHGETGKAIFERMKSKNLMPLAWGENGFRQLTNSRRPIVTPKDMKGLKVRVVGSPIFIDIFRQLGADPVNMNWGDAVTSFQQGVVDGQENPVAILLAVKIWQYHKYATFWNYLVDPLILYWNKEQWDAFPKDIQIALKEAALEAARFEKALCRAGLDNGDSLKVLKDEFAYDMPVKNPLKVLKGNGIAINYLSDSELENFKMATRPVFKKWSAILGEELMRKAHQDLAGEK